MKLIVVPLLILLAVSCPCLADTPPRYKMTVLPLTFQTFDSLNYAPTAGGGINNTGQITGEIMVRSGRLSNRRAAIWQKKHSVKLLDKTPVTTDIAEEDPSNRNYTFSTAINAHGEVVGGNYLTFSGAYSGIESSAYIWTGGRVQEITKFPYDCNGIAFGINDHGMVVGNYVYNKHMPTTDDPPPPPIAAGSHAFLVRGSRVIPLWSGIARGISNYGWIVGTQSSGGYDRSRDKGVLWRSGHLTLFKMQPVAISESGEIAGNIPITEDDGRACVWQQGRVTRLSKQMSHAYALNNRQQVVGELGSEAKPLPTHAVLWQDGRTYDLNRCVPLPKGWVLNRVIGINDQGWIIGEGSVSKTLKGKPAVQIFTFLLTPR